MTIGAPARLAVLLRALYGERSVPALLAGLEALLGRWRARLPIRGPAGLTERDAFLITYPDQVREAEVAPLKSLTAFCRERLSGLISGVHVLPFYPSSSDDGFSVVDHRAVDPSLGTWEDLAELGRDFRLMFDAVINHASAGSPEFQGFLRDEPRWRDFFVTIEGAPDLSRVVRPRAQPLVTPFTSASGERRVWTTFSADQVDWNYRNPQVLFEILEVLLHLVWRGAELLRLDAVAYLWKEPGTACIHLAQTHTIIQLLRAVLDEVAPHVLLVSETNVSHAENISYFGDGKNEAQLVYNFALPPLVLHAVHRQTAEVLRAWAGGLRLPGEQTAFLNFLASHDGVGLNPGRGLLAETEIAALVEHTLGHGGRVSMKAALDGSEIPYELNINYLDALCPAALDEPLAVARFLTAHAIMLALAGVPAIYFHSLFGSRGWEAGVRRSGHSRSVNREKLARGDLERELAQAGGLRAQIVRGLGQLLRVRRSTPAFHPGAPQTILDCGPKVFGLVRGEGQAQVVCLHNLSDEAQIVRLEAQAPLSGGESWRDLLRAGEAHTGRTGLSAWQTRWLVPSGSPMQADRPRPAGDGR